MKLGSQRHQNHQTDEENPYWISFSDIMSGLLVVFVLASLALILELTKTRFEVKDVVRKLAKAEQIRREIVREIQQELLERDIKVLVTDNDSVIRIENDLLTFDSDQHRIPQQYEVNAIQIGQVLHQAIEKRDRWKYLDTIFIEGHTDMRPSPREMGNWGLSTFRAISVWNFWNENLPEGDRLDDLNNYSGTPLFSVSGYGETRPLRGEQVTEEDFSRNRRIDIRFTVKQPTLEDYKNLQKMLEQ